MKVITCVFDINADAQSNAEKTMNTTITASETDTTTVPLNIPKGSNIIKVEVFVPDELYIDRMDNIVSESDKVKIIKPNP